MIHFAHNFSRVNASYKFYFFIIRINLKKKKINKNKPQHKWFEISQQQDILADIRPEKN